MSSVFFFPTVVLRHWRQKFQLFIMIIWCPIISFISLFCFHRFLSCWDPAIVLRCNQEVAEKQNLLSFGSIQLNHISCCPKRGSVWSLVITPQIEHFCYMVHTVVRLSSSAVRSHSRCTQGHSHSNRRVINIWTLVNTWPWAWVLRPCGNLIGLMRGAHIGQVSYSTGKVTSCCALTHTAASSFNCGARVSCRKLRVILLSFRTILKAN